MGLWDSDDDDGGWSSEEEHPSPKKVKVVPRIGIPRSTEDSSPDQVDRSILGNKLERRVSWDKILEEETPFNLDSNPSALHLELMYLEGQPMTHLIGKSGKMRSGNGSYRVVVVDAVYLPDVNGGAYKLRLDIERVTPKLVRHFVCSIMKINRCPKDWREEQRGRQQGTCPPNFYGELSPGDFADEVCDLLQDLWFEDDKVFKQWAEAKEDLINEHTPHWRYNLQDGLTTAYHSFDTMRDRLLDLSDMLKQPVETIMKNEKSIVETYEDLKNEYMDYLKNWIQNPPTEENLYMLKYRLSYLKRSYMALEGEVADEVREDPTFKFLDLDSSQDPSEPIGAEYVSPGKSSPAQANRLKQIAFIMLEYEQLHGLYKQGTSGKVVSVSMDWFDNTLGNIEGWHTIFGGYRTSFWHQAETDLRKAIENLHPGVEIKIDRKGNILLNGRPKSNS